MATQCTRSVAALVTSMALLAVPRCVRADEPEAVMRAVAWSPEADADVPRRMQDPTLFGVGVASAIAGGVAVNVGTAFVLSERSDFHVVGGLGTGHDDLTLPGVITIAGGIALIAAGIPLALHGGKKAPRASTTASGLVVRF